METEGRRWAWVVVGFVVGMSFGVTSGALLGRSLAPNLVFPSSMNVTVTDPLTNPPSDQNVLVTAVNWYFTGAPNCWTPTTGSGIRTAWGREFPTDPGTAVSGGEQLSKTLILTGSTNPAPHDCTVQSVAVNTAGFSLVSANIPLTVSGSAVLTLSVTVRAPNSSFTGVLILTATVTTP